MQMNVAGLRRNIKNLAHNYSEAQVNERLFLSEKNTTQNVFVQF
jgi:hypothetical protein